MITSHDGRAISRVNQLELWDTTAAPAPARGLHVIRRDGRETAFDIATLSASILRAGWPGESLDGDTAQSLARAVRLYLQHSSSGPVPVETLRQTVERLLLDMGYALTARMYAGAFAPVSGIGDADGAAGMFDEALPLERAERSIAALAADAGLDAESAEALVTELMRQISASGVRALTPALLREWTRAELHARGRGAAAKNIGRISLPVSALHDAFATAVGPSSAAPADPQSAALALAGRVSAAYVVGQLLPSAAGQAHLRGEIHVRGTGNFVRLDSVLLDAEGLKDSGFSAPPDSAATLTRQISGQTELFLRYFGGQISWSAINFGFAPLFETTSDDAVISAVRDLFSAPRAHEKRLEFGLAWDAPEHYPSELIATGGEHMPLADAYPAARRFFGSALEVLCDVSEKGWPIPAARVAIHLSPYFFGASEAERYLELLGRIAVGSLPITLWYEPAASMLLDESNAAGRPNVTAQTVCIPLARAARLAGGVDDLLTRLDATLDAAIAAHRSKFAFIERVMRERGGPLSLLSRRYGPGPFARADAMQYRIELADTTAAAISKAGIPWIVPGEEVAIIETVLPHVRDACARWSAATGQIFALSGADLARTSSRTDQRPPHVALPMHVVALEGALHPLYDVPPPFALAGDTFSSPGDAADFIRHAFMHTPCRALYIA